MGWCCGCYLCSASTERGLSLTKQPPAKLLKAFKAGNYSRGYLSAVATTAPTYNQEILPEIETFVSAPPWEVFGAGTAYGSKGWSCRLVLDGDAGKGLLPASMPSLWSQEPGNLGTRVVLGQTCSARQAMGIMVAAVCTGLS